LRWGERASVSRDFECNALTTVTVVRSDLLRDAKEKPPDSSAGVLRGCLTAFLCCHTNLLGVGFVYTVLQERPTIRARHTFLIREVLAYSCLVLLAHFDTGSGARVCGFAEAALQEILALLVLKRPFLSARSLQAFALFCGDAAEDCAATFTNVRLVVSKSDITTAHRWRDVLDMESPSLMILRR
jgi:hypothetical protein